MRAIKKLKQTNIPYKLISFDKKIHSAQDVADIANCDLSKVLKTIGFISQVKSIFVVVPGDRKIDTKKLKAVTSLSGLRIATPEEVFDLSGYVIGSVSPIGISSQIDVYIDTSILTEEGTVLIGSGRENTVIKMRPDDVKFASNAKAEDVIAIA